MLNDNRKYIIEYYENFDTNLDENIWDCNGSSIENGVLNITAPSKDVGGACILKKFNLAIFKEFEISFELYNPGNNRISYGIINGINYIGYLTQDINKSQIFYAGSQTLNLQFNLFSQSQWHELNISRINDKIYLYFDNMTTAVPSIDSQMQYFRILKWYSDYLLIKNFKFYRILYKQCSFYCKYSNNHAFFVFIVCFS